MNEFLKDFGGATDLAKSLGLTNTDPLQKAEKKWYDSLNLTFIADPVRMDKHNTIATLMAELHPKITVAQRQKTTLGIKLPDPQSPEHPVFLQSTYKELAERNRDFILPGLEKIPANRAVLLQTNQAFIDAYMVGLNHEMGREFLWREFPSPLNAVYFPHFWDNRDARSQAIDFQKMKRDWASRTPLGTLLRSKNGGGQSGNQDGSDTQNSVVLVIRGDLFRKYPNTEVMMLKGEIKNGKIKLPGNMDKAEFWSESSAVLLRPSFSARLEPDFFFIGFNLKLEEAKRPECFFVLKERAGEVHFGLDLLQVDSDPSWQQLEDTAPNQCIQVNSPKFKAMLPNTLRSDRVASALWQKPFMMLLPTERLIPSHS